MHPEIVQAVRRALAEDVGSGDITTEICVPAGRKAEGRFVARQQIIAAGLELLSVIYEQLGGVDELRLEASSGACINEGQALASVRGPARTLLTAERTALNFLQRLSGIATVTRQYVDAIAGTNAKIVDTRKTTPGLRMLEKYAVTCGGGHNHRLGLDDGVLIKDNHIALAGNVSEAVRRARETAGHLHKIEVEVSNFDQLREALQAKADIVMLDNMTPEQVREAIAIINQHESHDRRTLTEASGGVTLLNVRAFAEAGVDLISIGALTHSAPAVDISFKLKSA